MCALVKRARSAMNSAALSTAADISMNSASRCAAAGYVVCNLRIQRNLMRLPGAPAPTAAVTHAAAVEVWE
jgi:hypothetical protein